MNFSRNIKNIEKSSIFRIKHADIFHPFILVIVMLLFIAISIPMLYFSDELPIPSINLFYCISIGIIFFVLGI
ncbi:MAG: hypothetical protein LBM26_04370, partial [Methanobrevibacter sp.]|nr:hypothetical protein [Methanobrevibacter sp.]